MLETNDREQLIEQKKQIESQMSAIKADIATVFGEINAKLESEKAEGVRELREASKDYLDIKERSGSKTVTTSYEVSDSRLLLPRTWGTSHTEYESHVEHYSYCIAADAVENLHKFSMEATNKIEEVFTDAIQIKEIKRKLLNVVVDNFDMGSEKYDSSLFRIMVEETVSAIEFPIFNIDISDAMDGIARRFSGEVTSASQKNELSTALSNAVSKIYDELCNGLIGSVKNFKDELMNIGHKVQDSLLSNIESEFELLLEQCENKDKEVAEYREYLSILEKELGTIK